MTSRGWCPDVFDPMPTGDGLLARIRPPLSRLSTTQARAVAVAAARLGNGVIELTARANLQLRGLSPVFAPVLAAEMVAAGLASADPAAERRRNVITAPLCGDDPAIPPATARIAAALEEALAGEAGLMALPAKFGFAVDGGGVLPLGGVPADVRITPSGVALDGAALLAPCDNPVTAALRLVRVFLAHRDGAARMRDVVRAMGAEALFAAAGLSPVPLEAARAAVAIGYIGYAGHAHGCFGFGLPFGAAEAGALATLAGFAEQHGDATLRLTPWRAVVLTGIAARDAPALEAQGRAAGLIVDLADPRLLVHACAGTLRCAAAEARAREDAALLACGVALHVSGCAKGCAHPAPSPFTLVGRAGLYDLVRDGRAGDTPALRGLTLDEARTVLLEATA